MGAGPVSAALAYEHASIAEIEIPSVLLVSVCPAPQTKPLSHMLPIYYTQAARSTITGSGWRRLLPSPPDEHGGRCFTPAMASHPLLQGSNSSMTFQLLGLPSTRGKGEEEEEVTSGVVLLGRKYDDGAQTRMPACMRWLSRQQRGVRSTVFIHLTTHPSTHVHTEDLDGWTRHYRSLPWFTYRQGFRAMAPYPYTDDAGWGCMLVRACVSREMDRQSRACVRSPPMPSPTQHPQTHSAPRR